MMKLFWGPHTCAIGIHILLEELGVAYQTEQIDVSGGATREPAFLAINPKGKVPTLVRDDGSVLTEFSAIATWLARAHPDKELMPRDLEQEARVVETLAYVEGTIHGQGFARMFMPERFEPQDIIHQSTGIGTSSVEAQGRQILEEGFAILDPQLARHDYAVSDELTVADLALFYVERWATQRDILLPTNLKRHFDRMIARPAVHKVRQLWDEV
ncbi:glutathione S-transferase family protein [Roseomonas mucosa]|nr:glutathione S-transferase family protein [Roseomonas mucosa]